MGEGGSGGTDVRLTVVIPTYERAALIDRAVESVLAQRRPAERVIIVDDGSTDETQVVLQPYLDRVEVVVQANAGASVARNRGVAMADTEWVAFCDSDDMWYPDHLERLAGAIHATDGAAALYFDDTEIPASDGGGTFFGVAGLRPDGHELAMPPVAWMLGRLQPMLLQSSVIRRSIYQELGGLAADLRTRHDTHLFHRIGFRHPVCAVDGLGGRLCDDASDEERLTGHNGQRSADFWKESLEMHRDLAACAPDRASRRHMVRRAAGDHLRLAGHAWRSGARAEALRHLAAGGRSPATLSTMVGRGLRRRLARQEPTLGRIPR